MWMQTIWVRFLAHILMTLYVCIKSLIKRIQTSELITLSGEQQMNLESLKAPIYIFVLFKQPGGEGRSYYKNEQIFTIP